MSWEELVRVPTRGERAKRLARIKANSYEAKQKKQQEEYLEELRLAKRRLQREYETKLEEIAEKAKKAYPVLNHKIEHVKDAVCRYYRMRVEDLEGQAKHQPLARRRFVCYYLCKEITLRSLPEIGRRLGGRDHTTILHGVRQIEKRLALGDPELAFEIDSIKALLP